MDNEISPDLNTVLDQEILDSTSAGNRSEQRTAEPAPATQPATAKKKSIFRPQMLSVLTPEDIGLKSDAKPDPADTSNQTSPDPPAEFNPEPALSSLNSETRAEYRQKRIFRWVMFICFFLLLVAQYVGLMVFVWNMVVEGRIEGIQPLLSIVIPATLGETYAIIRIMVTFVFSPNAPKAQDKS